MAVMARFVLLYHRCPDGYARASHWDFMLEVEGKLRTWALARLPRAWEAARERTAEMFVACAAVSDDAAVEAERLADHRIEYLKIEGAIGGDRGEVWRVDAGSYETVAEASDEWRVRIDGAIIRGEVMLTASRLTVVVD